MGRDFVKLLYGFVYRWFILEVMYKIICDKFFKIIVFFMLDIVESMNFFEIMLMNEVWLIGWFINDEFF